MNKEKSKIEFVNNFFCFVLLRFLFLHFFGVSLLNFTNLFLFYIFLLNDEAIHYVLLFGVDIYQKKRTFIHGSSSPFLLFHFKSLENSKKNNKIQCNTFYYQKKCCFEMFFWAKKTNILNKNAHKLRLKSRRKQFSYDVKLS